MKQSNKLYNIILHLSVILSIGFGVTQCNRAQDYNKELSESSEILEKANKIVSITLDSDSNKIIKSIPSTLSETANVTKTLIDSVKKEFKIDNKETIVRIIRVPIQSSTSLKAKEVNSEYAYTENENWYAKYAFKDSVFDLRYKTVYESVVTEKSNSILGFEFKPKTLYQYDVFKDKHIDNTRPTTIILKESDKIPQKFSLNNTNKFRSYDNSLLSGIELELHKNRVIFSGQYLYNFNTSNPEWEISTKFKIFSK